MNLDGNDILIIISLAKKIDEVYVEYDERMINFKGKDNYSIILNKEIFSIIKDNSENASDLMGAWLSLGVSTDLENYRPSFMLNLKTLKLLNVYGIKFLDIDVYV